MFSRKENRKHAIASFGGISSVNYLVYQKCSLRSIIAQITFKQMSEGPLFVWIKPLKEHYFILKSPFFSED